MEETKTIKEKTIELIDALKATCQTYGIVEKTEGSTVYTVEGNSSDAVNQRSYDINNGTIMGYGIL